MPATNSTMLLAHILAQSSDDDVSATSALVAFLIVMAVVIVSIAFIRRRSPRGLRDPQIEQDEMLRQQLFEEKMRRVEERLRDSDTESEGQVPGESSEP